MTKAQVEQIKARVEPTHADIQRLSAALEKAMEVIAEGIDERGDRLDSWEAEKLLREWNRKKG